MKIVVLGAGHIGAAVAKLLSQTDVDEIVIIDRDDKAAVDALDGTDAKNKNITIRECDFDSVDQVATELEGANCAINCLPYYKAVMVTRAAIQAHCHLVDLGGHDGNVRTQLGLNQEAIRAGVLIVPDCGLAPGLTNVLARVLSDEMENLRSLKLYCGGLPQKPKAPFNYARTWSTEGLINEYSQPCITLNEGMIRERDPLNFIDTHYIGFNEDVIGDEELPLSLESFNTSGGVSTLPETFAGKLDHLQYQTIRYEGHREMMEGLILRSQLHLPQFRTELIEFLEKILPETRDDIVLFRASGYSASFEENISYSLCVRSDRELTAMQRCTAVPAVALAHLITTGHLQNNFGVKTQEHFSHGPRLLELLEDYGLKFVRYEGVLL